MPSNYSPEFRNALTATAPADQPVYLLEIDHPLMPEPARVVNDTQNLVGPGGEVYVAAPFRFKRPDESDRQLPRATLQVDNTSRDLMAWIEQSQGGRDATVRVMAVRRGAPTVIEDDFNFGLRSLSANVKDISVGLGYENLLDIPAIAIRHDPAHTPGIF
jgi:hypothetical protein